MDPAKADATTKERYKKMEHLNKVATDIQNDSLEEQLYLHLNRWKKNSGIIIIGLFAFFFLTLGVTDPDLPIDSEVVGYIIFVAFMVLMFGSLVIWERQRRRSHYIQHEYERRQYFLILSSMEGEGETALEKFMDLAIRVFPSLKQAAKKHGFSKDWWLEETKKRGEVKYDISVSVSSSLRKTWFLVKRFDKTVTFDDIKELYMRDPAERKKTNILRIVAIAKDYDQSFFTDEFDEQMKDLLFNQRRDKFLIAIGGTDKGKREARLKHPDSVQVDLLVEHENGFSPLWLS